MENLLFKSSCWDLDPQKGKLTKPGDYQIGYLSQEPDLDPEKSVLETVFEGNTPIMNAVRQYEQLLLLLTEKPNDKKLKLSLQKHNNKWIPMMLGMQILPLNEFYLS